MLRHLDRSAATAQWRDLLFLGNTSRNGIDLLPPHTLSKNRDRISVEFANLEIEDID
jgi:hypothetical protein